MCVFITITADFFLKLPPKSKFEARFTNSFFVGFSQIQFVEDDDDEDEDDISPSTGLQSPAAAAPQTVQQAATVVEESPAAADYPVGDTEGASLYDDEENNVEVDNIQNGIDLNSADSGLKDSANEVVSQSVPAATVQQQIAADSSEDEDDDEDDDDDDVTDIEEALDDDGNINRFFMKLAHVH